MCVCVCPWHLWSRRARILWEIRYSVLLTSTFRLITLTANYDLLTLQCRPRHADKQVSPHGAEKTHASYLVLSPIFELYNSLKSGPISFFFDALVNYRRGALGEIIANYCSQRTIDRSVLYIHDVISLGFYLFFLQCWSRATSRFTAIYFFSLSLSRHLHQMTSKTLTAALQRKTLVRLTFGIKLAKVFRLLPFQWFSVRGGKKINNWMVIFIKWFAL